MSMTIAQAKSELMQIYGALSPVKQRAIDTLVKIELCEDAVSRKSLLDKLDPLYKEKIKTAPDNMAEGFMQVSNLIKYEPPVTPKPKTGHWIEHDWEQMREKGYYRCSVCNHGYQRYTKGIRKSNIPYIDGQEYELHNIDKYCPNCGAKMESEE